MPHKTQWPLVQDQNLSLPNFCSIPRVANIVIGADITSSTTTRLIAAALVDSGNIFKEKYERKEVLTMPYVAPPQIPNFNNLTKSNWPIPVPKPTPKPLLNVMNCWITSPNIKAMTDDNTIDRKRTNVLLLCEEYLLI